MARLPMLAWLRGSLLGSALVLVVGAASPSTAASFESDWSGAIDRVWPGGAYWSNPLQDWRVRDGSLVCVNPANNRNVHLLTHQLNEKDVSFETSVTVSYSEKTRPNARAGFLLGVDGAIDDHRYAAVRGGGGTPAGLTPEGKLHLAGKTAGGDLPLSAVTLRLRAEPADGGFTAVLTAHAPDGGEALASVRKKLSADALVGNLALACDGKGDQGKGHVAYSGWSVSGDKVTAHPDHAFGPILHTMYTLSRGTLNMTAQMAPVGEANNRTVRLEVRKDGDWSTADTAEIHALARTATFRVTDWNSAEDVPYRVVYEMKRADGSTRRATWSGTVRKEPVDKSTVTVAGFTGNKDYAFPDTPVVKGVRHHDPDVLVFTGDQIYENVAGYGVRRVDDVSVATLDYLRKWYLLGWSWRHLTKNRPTVCLPDDHDVYQGNIWGSGGRSVPSIGKHARGGYGMPPKWVNMVQRTQTSHLPAPYDPEPVAQGIGVYYTDMLYGGISFAVIEDRKFKTGPAGYTPTQKGRPDHVQAPSFDPQTVDFSDARLLGERQLKFLRDWSGNWKGVDMKMALSQTVFAGVPNIHGGGKRLVADLDSNGWPPSARNRALEVLRRGYAFHLNGDQHLPMLLHYGVNDWGDAPYTLSVPSIAAGYPRAFRPKQPGKNRKEGMPKYTGQFHDGFGNKFTAWAVANPGSAPEPKGSFAGPYKRAHRKSSGYGLVRMHKERLEITIECWPELTNPAVGKTTEQFPGWPKTVKMAANYGRVARGRLPTIRVRGMEDPVVKVYESLRGRLVHARRYRGQSVRPKVFHRYRRYHVKVGEPGEQMKTVKGLEPVEGETDRTVEVEFK